LCFVVFYILLNKTPMGKIVSLEEHSGWRTASRNELNSWTELYSPNQLCFLPIFPIWNFAVTNICLYTIPPTAFWSSS
jgi:hypothetical protein